MIIKQKRVRNLHLHLGPIRKGTRIVFGVKDIARFKAPLKEAGFTDDLESGETILPAPTFGPVSRFNAEGKYQVHRDKPMETAYRLVEWHWKEWHGPYRVEQSDYVDVPYKRYPRTFIPPPSVELGVATTEDGDKLVVSPAAEYVDENEQLLRHTINLFLELFGECAVLTADLDEFIQSPVRRLNWRVLPPGRWPWSALRKEIDPLIVRAPRGNQPLIRHRFERINSYNPDFLAVGQAGFRGYVIFGFSEKNLYICESIYL